MVVNQYKKEIIFIMYAHRQKIGKQKRKISKSQNKSLCNSKGRIAKSG
jgi:hypothetical protein